MEQSENKRKKRKKAVMTVLFILLNIAVIAWTAIKEFGGESDSTRFSDVNINYIYIIPAALCCFGAIFAETVKYALLMKKVDGRVDFKVARRVVLLGRYYDNVTPSGIGGQPFQIYYMSKNGYSDANSAAIPLAGFMSMQYAFILLAAVCFIFGSSLLNIAIIRVSCWIGLFFYAMFPTCILISALFPKLFSRLLAFFVRLLSRMRLVKNKEEKQKKLTDTVSEYAVSLRGMLAMPSVSVGAMVLSVIYQTLLCSIPYFVLRAFGGAMAWLPCFVTTVAIYASVTFIPTPGNAGAAEGSFFAVFSALSSGYIFWAMMAWRFFVYYIFIILGALIYIRSWLDRRKNGKEELPRRS